MGAGAAPRLTVRVSSLTCWNYRSSEADVVARASGKSAAIPAEGQVSCPTDTTVFTIRCGPREISAVVCSMNASREQSILGTPSQGDRGAKDGRTVGLRLRQPRPAVWPRLRRPGACPGNGRARCDGSTSRWQVVRRVSRDREQACSSEHNRAPRPRPRSWF